MVPAKHRIDSFCDFGTVGFVDATAIYPEIFQPVTFGLFSTELYLAIASLALTRAIYQIRQSYLLRFPSV